MNEEYQKWVRDWCARHRNPESEPLQCDVWAAAWQASRKQAMEEAANRTMFKQCVLQGDPPEGFATWMEWLERGMPYKNVTIRASTAEDWKQKD